MMMVVGDIQHALSQGLLTTAETSAAAAAAAMSHSQLFVVTFTDAIELFKRTTERKSERKELLGALRDLRHPSTHTHTQASPST